MEPTLGAELPPQRSLTTGLVIGAVVLAVPTSRVLWSALRADGVRQWIAGGAGLMMLALLVAAPLWLARASHRYRIWVSAEAVTRTSGPQVRLRIPYAEADQVRVRWERHGGMLGGDMSIYVDRVDERGRRVSVWASGLLVRDVRPLAQALNVEVQRRPELLATDEDRRNHARLLAGNTAAPPA